MFNVSGLDLLDPCTYHDQEGGWKCAVLLVSVVVNLSINFKVPRN